jgi:predicted nucleic acid-binding protein
VTTFVDTSAFLTLVDDADERFSRASGWLEQISHETSEVLITHNYAVAETFAVLRRRFDDAATRAFVNDLLPVCEVRFADADLHTRAVAAYIAGFARRVSFVDRVSFELMRGERIERAFAFDRDFAREGFETVP